MKVKQIQGNRRAWLPAERFEVIALYNKFLQKQTAGEKYQKAAPVRACAERLERSKGSIECKLMNISAIREAAGLPIVQGYKPLHNVEAALVEQCRNFWGIK